MRIAALISMSLALALPAGCRADSTPDRGAAARDEELPKLTGRVVDKADLLPAPVEARLSAQSAAVEKDVGPQYVIVTVPDLGGERIEHFGLRLGRAWGIGHKGVDDGLLLIVASNQHQVRIEVGKGLEKRVTDAYAAKVIRDDMIPRFSKGDYTGAIEAGSADLIRRLRSRQTDREIAVEDRMVT